MRTVTCLDINSGEEGLCSHCKHEKYCGGSKYGKHICNGSDIKFVYIKHHWFEAKK